MLAWSHLLTDLRYRPLPSSHATPPPRFAAAAALEQRLRQNLAAPEGGPDRGLVRFDSGARALYATDSSNYRQIPIGVVLPRHAADVEAVVAACREFGAPVLARGAGTSLAGQTCNVAVVLDFTRYMGRLLALDPGRRRARVQPGIVLDRVREAAEPYHLTFAPDPATHSRCTLGGMIGNNSCGVHSLMGGKTAENVESLDLVLYDGTTLRVGATTPAEMEAIIAGGGRRGAIYAGLRGLVERYGAAIRSGFPQIPRCVSGYNLQALLPENGCQIARALVGSEGTCAIVVEAELRLHPSPPCRTLVALGFSDAFAAADAVPAVLAYHPIGLEGMDGRLIELVQGKPPLDADVKLLPAGQGFLLAELGAWDPRECEDMAQRLAGAADSLPGAPSSRVYAAADAHRIWRVREAGLGVTAFPKDRPPGWEGWEDAAVAPARLGSYLRGLRRLLDQYGYDAPMYGHFGEGCVHLRINFDFESEAGILAYRRFLDDAADLVAAHGGSFSGEHGDGQARGALLPRMFGPELMRAFGEFKRIWDPQGRMNPGKLVDANQPHADLRFGADYRPVLEATQFSFAADRGSFSRAVSRCVGVGACRKEDAGAMCPSYMATREERYSTRGRAHLLWELLQGEALPGGWQNEEVKDALDWCLSCKACKSECPVSVDMATYKAEFLAQYYQGRPRPLMAQAFGRIDQWARRASRTPALANRLSQSRTLGGGMRRLLDVHPERHIPEVHRAYRRTMRTLPAPAGAPRVLLWADTFNDYFHPATLFAAQRVLTQAGFAVETPRQHLCCGRPLYDFGMLDTARSYLRRVLAALEPTLAARIPVVVLEPSCASVFRDEMTNLLPHDARAATLRDRTFLLSEFLVKHAPAYRPPMRAGKLLVHGHCHHHAVMRMDDEMTLLRATGAEVELLDSGCCGMAGPFGFERDKFTVSQTLGERVLLPRVRASSVDTVIVTDGFSCREQIAQSTPRRARHLAEVLDAAEG